MQRDLVSAIIEKDTEKVLNIIPVCDPNELYDYQSLLRISIRGCEVMKENQFTKGSREIVQILLEHGANPNLRSNMDKPLYVAVSEGRLNIVIMLLLFGADPNSYKICKRKGVNPILTCVLPLEYAIYNGRYTIVEVLVKYGAIYNKNTIEYAENLLLEAEESSRNSMQEKEKYFKMEQIVQLLNNHYINTLEDDVNRFLKDNDMIGNCYTYFESLLDQKD